MITSFAELTQMVRGLKRLAYRANGCPIERGVATVDYLGLKAAGLESLVFDSSANMNPDLQQRAMDLYGVLDGSGSLPTFRMNYNLSNPFESEMVNSRLTRNYQLALNYVNAATSQAKAEATLPLRKAGLSINEVRQVIAIGNEMRSLGVLRIPGDTALTMYGDITTEAVLEAAAQKRTEYLMAEMQIPRLAYN